MIVDQKLSWVLHVLETQESFANKLNLLKRPRFLTRDILKEFHFKEILTSVKYGLVLWGSCNNTDIFGSIERLHCRAARIRFNLPKDMTSSNMLRYDQWPIPSLYYKSDIFKLFYTGYNATLPDSLSENMHKCCSNGYSLSGHDLLTIPRFQTRYMKDSLKYHGAVLWNAICYNEQEVGHLSLNNLKKLPLTRDKFKFDILSAFTTGLIHTSFVFTWKL